MVSIYVDEQLAVCSFKDDDAASLFAAIDTNRVHLQPWLDWVGKTTKPEHSLQFIQDAAYQREHQEGLALGIFKAGRLIGGIGMHDWHHPTGRAQVGYWIGKEHEGQGIVSQCLQKFIDHLFSRIGLNKVEIRFVPANVRSAALAGRLGFRTEGIIRQSIMNNGLIDDLVVTGMLKKDWENTKPID